MTVLAETVDAVIGIDTHRDSHEVEIADAAGKPIAVMRIGNDSAGFAQLLAAIAELVPGPRVAVCIEGTRGYGIGLARALAAASLLVLECEQPSRRQRRGKGKSDPIDAHLAVLAALRLDADRRGRDHPGDPALPQAIHRPRALPAAHPVDESSRGSLTNIEASEGLEYKPTERCACRKSHPSRWELLFVSAAARMSWLLSGGRPAAE